MIILNVIYKCRPEMRDEFLEKIMTEGIDAASQAETGNIKYDYYIPADGSNELLLVEKWQNAEALSEHMKRPHFIRLGELKSEFVEDISIDKFEI